jgi:hypothetical protein
VLIELERSGSSFAAFSAADDSVFFLIRLLSRAREPKFFLFVAPRLRNLEALRLSHEDRLKHAPAVINTCPSFDHRNSKASSTTNAHFFAIRFEITDRAE